MGLLNALLGSADRFRDDLLPAGFDEAAVKWVLDVTDDQERASLLDVSASGGLRKLFPSKPPSRTSSNISPAFLADKAEYVLGIQNAKKRNAAGAANASRESFRRLTRQIAARTGDARILKVADALDADTFVAANHKIEADDKVAIRLNGTYLCDIPELQQYWRDYLAAEIGGEKASCSQCGRDALCIRLFPGDIALFSVRGVKIASVDSRSEKPDDQDQRVDREVTSAFTSRGKLQLLNSPICFGCACKARQVLQRLISGHNAKGHPTGLNYAVLARDDAKGSGKQPLRNQLAVFWTKQKPQVPRDTDTGQTEIVFDPENLSRHLSSDLHVPEDDPPPEDAQVRAMLAAPWSAKLDPTKLADDAFYLAVLSPNKTRLVLRDWIETDISSVHHNIGRYISASRIVHPDGRGIWFAPIPALLDALHHARKEASDSRRANDPQLLRGLLRTAYLGYPPPPELLSRAARRFAVPNKPDESQQSQMLRQMNLAAAMKLVLTHSQKQEVHQAMEQVNPRHRQPEYLCGRLLAVLEEIQRQASAKPGGVNTTLVDRFYGTASTAPASVFANLINMTSKAHLPKLRREGRDFIAEQMESICRDLDDAGGFPPPLSPEQQAEFALGFYHQRADYSSIRRGAKLERERKKAATTLTKGDTNG